MVTAAPGDRAFNTDSSGEAQANFNRVANQLESLLSLRDQQVKAAMAYYTADGVSADYAAKEAQWNSKANEVRGIITLLQRSLAQNDESALAALKKAGAAVNNIV